MSGMQFTEALRGLPERWWFRADENDAQEKRFSKLESKKQMRVRRVIISQSPCHVHSLQAKVGTHVFAESGLRLEPCMVCLWHQHLKLGSLHMVSQTGMCVPS